MRFLVSFGLASIALVACAGCQQDALPTAPPPVHDRYSGTKVEAPEVVLSQVDRARKYQGEGGPSAAAD